MTTHPAGQLAPDENLIRFDDRLLPGIEAGRYLITVEQRLPSAHLPEDGLGTVEQIVDVRAPQFRLDPSWVHAVYPAPHSQGPFHDLLPHITLDTAALPWQRRPFTDQVPGRDKAPWLALLLFGEGELPGDPNALGTTDSVTVRTLLDGDTAVQGPALDQDSADPALLDTPCQVIDVPKELLEQLLPKAHDLGLLAHARTGGRDAAPAEGPDTGAATYAVVTTTRFPTEAPGAKAARYAAHLVSLEGHQEPTARADGRPVRLVSLHSWTFTSCPRAGESFRLLAERFAQGNGEHGAAPLRPPAAGTGLPPHLGTLLEQGLVPMTHITDSGERALAWYNGPFLPRVAPALPRPADGHFPDADSLLLHEPRTGTFAAGYACAWNTGRALALADPGFATTLVRLRHQGRLRRATVRQYATYQRQLYGGDLPTGPAADGSPRELFEELLRGGTLDALATALGAPENESRVPATAPVAHRRDAPRDPSAPREPSPDAREAAQWLNRLRTLSGVPFDCLVPDQRMLPPESLRLFHVDRGWLDALLDGARSLDRHSDADAATDAELDGLLDAHGTVPTAGLLLRSALVPGWPSLIFEAAAGTTPVEVIRSEALGADVLLMLFDRMPDRLTLSEPPQGLHFGVDSTRNATVTPRTLTPGRTGTPLEGRAVTASITTTAAGARVLDAGRLAALLAQELAPEIAPRATLTPAEFAVQLVRAPQRLTLSFEGTR
ncbi:hypothetical protein AB0E00_00740 [Streptomyces sp. NPDC048110]|uniref:hypothetical protein n=1 Tax=Streptomyces sp. NPDC048110 TaxID=3155483 RepID=UPI0033C25D1D